MVPLSGKHLHQKMAVVVQDVVQAFLDLVEVGAGTFDIHGIVDE